MESFENERSVQQGEDWNLDVLLSASDREYIPFIISSERQNPYFAVTVASTKFEKNLRYVKTWWNSVDDTLKIPRFYQTTPEYFGQLSPGIFGFDGNVENLGEIGGKLSLLSVTTGNSYTEQNGFVYKQKTADLSYPTSDNTDISVAMQETNATSKVYVYTIKNDPYDLTYHAYVDYNTETLVTDNGTESSLSDMWGSFKAVMSGLIPNIPASTDINPTYGDGPTTRILYYYTFSEDEVDPELGHKPYYYFYYNYEQQEIDGETKWVLVGREDEYECRLTQNFLSKDTAEWRSQNYLYQITLVSGYLMSNVLNAIYLDKVNAGYDLSDYPKNEDDSWQSDEDTSQNLIEARYNYIKTRWPKEFQPDIDADSPLGYIEIPEPILRPTKLEVFNNLRTLL